MAKYRRAKIIETVRKHINLTRCAMWCDKVKTDHSSSINGKTIKWRVDSWIPLSKKEIYKQVEKLNKELKWFGVFGLMVESPFTKSLYLQIYRLEE